MNSNYIFKCQDMFMTDFYYAWKVMKEPISAIGPELYIPNS